MLKFALGFVIQFLTFVEKLPFSVAEFGLSIAELIFLTGTVLFVFLFIETQSKMYFKGILISLLILLGTSLVIKTTNLYRKEMIVYNQNGQVLIHFIHGKTNYIVSKEELAETGYELNAVENTRRRLGLNIPVILNSHKDFHDKFIFLKKGIVVFDGRIISFIPPGEELPETIIPDFVIDPPSNKLENITAQIRSVVISSNRFSGRQNADDSNIFYLQEKGAFREKW